MINRIVKSWDSLNSLKTAQSFEYCGITSTNVEKYHTVLQTMLKTKISSSNLTIENQEEDEELISDVFITKNIEHTDDESEN